jgi:zeta-carotene desaturase
MGVPRVPLTELYSKAGDYIRAHGGEVRLKSAVSALETSAPEVSLCVAGEPISFDYAVSAVPFHVLARILPQAPEADPLRAQLARFQTSPITGIHLWFDRQITELDHAVLLDRTIQWMFHKSRLLDREAEGSYVELVVSASKSLLEKPRQEVIELALRELAEFFPVAQQRS